MNTQGSVTVFCWTAALLLAGAVALAVAFRGCGGAVAEPPAEAVGSQAGRAAAAVRSPHGGLAVAWRAAVGRCGGRPLPFQQGWVVATAAGAVIAFGHDGGEVWRAAFSNEVFAGVCELAGGRLALASEGGAVYVLDGATGAQVWRRATGSRFQHGPVASPEGTALWLVAQDDGRLLCLNAADGADVWTGEETNRCDGELAAWPGRLAYGNCDGAVYVFDAADGRRVGKVEVGEQDQMAGGVLALDERLVTGTRMGRLVLVNPVTLACEDSVKISEGEAFVTPVAVQDGLFAMGVDEGSVTFWRYGAQGLERVASASAGAAVRSLAAARGRVYALAGGTLVVVVAPAGRVVARLELGDDVGPLAAKASGEVACVADGALVCVRGGLE